jgi:hypothetical protein
MTPKTLIKVAALLSCTIPAVLNWFPGSAIPVLSGSGTNAVTAPLYADGSVQCSGADDLSDRVGRVILRPVGNGIHFQVVLTGAAPNWDYYVELSQNGVCTGAQQFHGFKTGGNGNGVFKGVYAANPGSYLVLVDVVSDPSSSVPPDPKHREIAPSDLLSVSVP